MCAQFSQFPRKFSYINDKVIIIAFKNKYTIESAPSTANHIKQLHFCQSLAHKWQLDFLCGTSTD